MRKLIILVILIFGASNFAFSKDLALDDLNLSSLKEIEVEKPTDHKRVDWADEGLLRTPYSVQVDWADEGLLRTPHSVQVNEVLPPGIDFAEYATEEEFSFERQAEAALTERIAVLKKAGITTFGGRVIEKSNRDYTYIIEYLPTVKYGAALPPALIVRTYKSGSFYWRESEAVAAMNSAVSNFKNARLSVLSSYVYEAGRDNTFAVDYAVKNVLRRTSQYDVSFKNYTGGIFSFESQAKRAIENFIALFEFAGVPVIRGKAVERSDGDYSVQIEYVVKTNKYGERPQFALARYESQEIFSFEKGALAASREKMAIFSNAGVAPVHNFAREIDNDYSFSLDYLIKNIYSYSGVTPSIAIKTYQGQEVFDFEREAKEAMINKTATFNAAGIAVISSRVIEVGRDYSYVLEYIAKASTSQIVHPHNDTPYKK